YGKEIRYCSNRKEAKDHGADKGMLLGTDLKDGDRLVIIEDVTTSGKSIDETIPIVQAQAKVKILGEMISLNRMEKALESPKNALEVIEAKYGFPVSAIVTMQEVIEHLYVPGGIITDDIKKELDAYYAQWGCC
ncbi:MAG: orotate phosphoribosyltransferase, partial [Treponema sp.]|nr:orotate phosphoribosyltransferase [Treponema sp.]